MSGHTPLSEMEMAAVNGGSLSIAVAPQISVDTSVITALQTNGGASVALGLLGGSASSSLAQLTSLGLVSLLR
jgi:hypothetical protein